VNNRVPAGWLSSSNMVMILVDPKGL
jgi:hypothetical protein